MRGSRANGTNPRALGTNPKAKKTAAQPKGKVKASEPMKPRTPKSPKPVREPVSQTTRFEVFKRDAFTCQYCGAKAPDVVLHADHIHPVAAGGKSDILNLVTACAGCNGGKGARLLDDRSAIERQRAQIAELQERREQLEMMLRWRDEVEVQRADVVGEICQRMAERASGYEPNESGRSNIRRWLKRFTAAEVLAAMDEAFDHYLKWDGNEPNPASWEVAFTKIPAIASLRQQAVAKPYIPKLAYIQGILRRRLPGKFTNYMSALEDAHLLGCKLENLETFAKRAHDWDDFCDRVHFEIDNSTPEADDGED